MGWEPFEYGDPLNPEKFNSKFKQVYSLLSKAFIYNNLLKRRLDTVNEAVTISSEIFSIESDGTLTGDVSEGRRLYNLPVDANDRCYELFIGGEYFGGATSTDVSLLDGSTLATDNRSAILELSGPEVSRVPLTTNEYGEQKPSLGTFVSSNTFDETKLSNILAPSAIWAEIVNVDDLETTEDDHTGVGVIEFTLPDSLSPYMNKVNITPLIGTSYRLYTYSGDAKKPVTGGAFLTGAASFYIERDIFDGRLRLELKGTTTTGGVGFGVINLGVAYHPFNDTGASVLKYSLDPAISEINITSIQNNQSLVNTSLAIYTDDVMTNQVYNSEQDGFSFTGNTTITKGAATQIDLYIKLDMEKDKGTTPTFPYLQIKYEDKTNA